MRVVILENADQVAGRAASLVLQQVQRKPDSVLGLATGGTPLATYRRLVDAARSGQVAFHQVTTFNLDEYVGLTADHPQSYRTYMRKELFEPAGFDLSRCHLPDGTRVAWEELQRECQSYERQIRESGGIDLQILGIGTDGHIAFNEPGSSLASRTRVKALTEQTRQDNARFFASPDDVPKLAITMGIGTILEARQIVLLATGGQKAKAVHALVEGPLTAQVPASALQMHPQVTVLLDVEAASWLARKDYYQHVEAIQSALESGGQIP
ncbi:MAG: glucosamine-6-phosphate deaminase [Planctomycetota bacterium]|nr:MAG: glucosamine-6-phosphate deaminase [Planctomycetota bacterium]